jgi:predicted ArsR family transcriptional regulator
VGGLDDLSVLAGLDDRVRRRVYRFVRGRGAPVSREDVAGAVGISRKLAAFHLDKLLELGLLRAHFARPSGRSGPGAGRPSKMYEPSSARLAVSIPERRYAVAGELLVDAIERTPSRATAQEARRVARERGVAMGEAAARAEGLRRPGPERTMSAATSVLDENGYEPYRDEAGDVRLRNCPFDDLARRAPDIVCEMNRSLVEGVVDGLGGSGVRCDLERLPDGCCVAIRRSGRR